MNLVTNGAIKISDQVRIIALFFISKMGRLKMKGADMNERNDSDKPIREVDNITAVDTMLPHKYSI